MTRLTIALVIGLVLGLTAGLLYAWVISPVQYTDINPSGLNAAQREEYLMLIASGYAADGNIARAKQRLAALGDPDVARTVTALAQRAAAEGRSPETVSALSALALALGVGPGPVPTAVEIITPTGAELPTLELPTPTAAITLFAPTPTGTSVYEYELASAQKICDPQLPGPMIQAQVQTADGKPIPGVEVVIAWDGGRDHFFTGFKPELGLGYGDFAMTPETTYSVSLAAAKKRAEGLFAEPCDAGNGKTFLGAWLVVFRRLP
ncbi:MAG: hypothetical protein HY260_00740 [Chloroflexi bacterium]|nr:hypothetical protein [Chloroflexota bacterium]